MSEDTDLATLADVANEQDQDEFPHLPREIWTCILHLRSMAMLRKRASRAVVLFHRLSFSYPREAKAILNEVVMKMKHVFPPKPCHYTHELVGAQHFRSKVILLPSVGGEHWSFEGPQAALGKKNAEMLAASAALEWLTGGHVIAAAALELLIEQQAPEQQQQIVVG
jgi:hypothetical protein